MSNKIQMKRKSEKSAIIFYQVKRQCKDSITPKRYISEWKSHWLEDFEQFKLEDGTFDDEKIIAFFKSMFNAYNEQYGRLTKEVMRGVRKTFTTKECMPAQVYNMAYKKGLKIHKTYSKCMGYSLGGFCICDSSNKVILGEKYDLSYHEVCQYLEIPSQDENRYLSDYKNKLEKGNYKNGNKQSKHDRKKGKSGNKHLAKDVRNDKDKTQGVLHSVEVCPTSATK